MSPPKPPRSGAKTMSPVIARSVVTSARHDMDGCRASSWRRPDLVADMRRSDRVTAGGVFEGVLTIASSSDSRRDIGPAADGTKVTIEAMLAIALEHRGRVRSGAGATEEDDTLKDREGRRGVQC